MRMCPCCGKDVVLLKVPENQQRPDRPKWVLCFLKGWDRSPWYAARGYATNAVRHPRKTIARYLIQNSEKPKPPEDPFFSLDTNG